MKNITNKLVIMSVFLLLFVQIIPNAKSEQLIINNTDIYNPFNLNIITTNEIDEIGAFYFINDTVSNEFVGGSFYVSGNVNITQPIFIVWTLSVGQNDSSVEFLSFLGSAKTDNTEILSYDIASGVLETFDSTLPNRVGNIIQTVEVGQYDNNDVIVSCIALNETNRTALIYSSTVYYAVEQISINFESGLEDWEWYFIIISMFAILNLITLINVKDRFGNFQILFLTVGSLMSALGLTFTTMILYPFIPLMFILYFIILNFPFLIRKNRNIEV